MSSILDEFACGNINTWELNIKRPPSYRKLVQQASDHEQALLKELNEDEKALYQKFFESWNAVMRADMTERFVIGYKLGALMTMEVMSDKDEIFK